MVRVVLVEDEPLLLRNIKQMIEEAHKNFKVVGEALNGIDALELIRKLSPDVVFTDIRMPLMDGLELLEKLQKEDNKPIAVVISGYQEFDYAKRALKLNVVDYLLKPISPEALGSLTCELYIRLESRKKDDVLNILKRRIQANEPFEGNEQEKTCVSCFSGLTCLYICTGSFCIYPCSDITPSMDFWNKTNLEEIAEKYLHTEDMAWVLDQDIGNEKALILGMPSDYQIRSGDIFRKVYTELTGLGFPITAVICKSASNLSELADSIKQAKQVLNRNIIFGKSNLIAYNSNISNPWEESCLIDLQYDKIICHLIKNLRQSQLKQELKRLLLQLEQRDCFQVYLESFLKNFIRLFPATLGFIPQEKMVEADMEINELISSNVHYETVYQGMSLLIDELLCLNNQKYNDKSSQKQLVKEIEKYIRSNFTRQITIQNLSDKFGLSAAHLIKIYKKYSGNSPMDHIIRLRIEKAQELLQIEPPLLLKDIAEIIGYDDPFYFSRIFKSITGQSPSEYRSIKNPVQ